MQIVMDDVGDLPQALIEQYNIRVIPINIAFGEEEYLSGITMNQAAFYEKTKHVQADNFPKTSQPTPYQFVEFYKEILATGEKEILSIVVSQKLSGTYDSAVQAAKELDGQATFHLIDTKAGSAPEGYMALEAARMIESGADVDAVRARLSQMEQEMAVIFTIDSLEYAVKGGRVSSLQSIMASLLNIKPILQLKHGVVEPIGRVRTRKKALAHIVDMTYEMVGDKPVKFAVMHAGAPTDAQRLYDIARPRFNVTEETVVDMAVSVAINLGPGALGLMAIPEASP